MAEDATIWKWALDPVPEQVIRAPRGTNLISAGWDPKTGPGEICVWGEVPDRAAETERIRILIVGTGHDLPSDRGRFIGTAVMRNTGLVWHVYVG